MLMVGSAVLYLRLLWLGGSRDNLLGFIGAALIAGWLLREYLRALRREGCSIVPYFEREIGGIDTFASGYAVARNCQRLDELAQRVGAEPLSEFGYEDDIHAYFLGVKAFENRLKWFDATRGRVAISKLLGAVRADPSGFKDADAIIAELERIEHALRKAAAANVRFCLLCRGEGVSPMEIEKREGTFW
ncbi:MAG TPA: hypothetical protein VEJ63_14285 [Planctomycetota bacterium]|nr:hypothetical protein [Planctomycetota bacterium]